VPGPGVAIYALRDDDRLRNMAEFRFDIQVPVECGLGRYPVLPDVVPIRDLF
jgi:hypothetical protein